MTIPDARTCFLEGPIGSGKTTALVAFVRERLDDAGPDRGAERVPVLVVTATPTRARELADRMAAPTAGELTVTTFFDWARRSIEAAWTGLRPMAGFLDPDAPPAFLSYETAQYTLSRLLDGRLRAGLFEDLHLSWSAVYDQLLDSMTLAAAHRLPVSSIGERLRAAWNGPDERLTAYDQAQACLDHFRAYALKRNLLDASLTLEAFATLLDTPDLRSHCLPDGCIVVADHVEEMPAVAHDWVAAALGVCARGVVTYDPDGGVRTILGIDPAHAYRLKGACDAVQVAHPSSRPPALESYADRLATRLRGRPAPEEYEEETPSEAVECIVESIAAANDAELVRVITDRIRRLITGGVSPGRIAVTAPYLDSVTRVAFGRSLNDAGVPFQVIRRSERLWERPVVHAAFTAYTLAHPGPLSPPTASEAAHLIRTATGIDPVRAHLLAGTLLDDGRLQPADAFPAADRSRISEAHFESYDRLLAWIDTAGERTPGFDDFLGRLGSDGPFTARTEASAPRVLDAFRRSHAAFTRLAPRLDIDEPNVLFAYRRMLERRVGADAYDTAADQARDAVCITPVLTLLLSGKSFDYQIWYDVGAAAWEEPIQQALTNPVILSPEWPVGKHWTLREEERRRGRLLASRTTALLARCRRGLVLTWNAVDSGPSAQDYLLGNVLMALSPPTMTEAT